MPAQHWRWATLDDGHLALVEEAERTLGTEFVLAFTEGDPPAIPPTFMGLEPAPLDESQLECLRGLESSIGAVAVAYRTAA